MSHDGSSAKSYIRHPTEKERLDNLAFASFPEDYLPYTATPGHHRSAVPPPYLLWGEDRRRKPAPRRKKPRCAGALLCAVVLVICAILAVAAISIYLGVVTNLFRSPVLSVSGRFRAPGDFSNDLLNSSSPIFQEKADAFQAEIERAFLSSSLEPAFIAARIYSFKPGLIVFFRVYLDRRKIVQTNGESQPTELVKDLVALKLTDDPNSVQVEEQDDLLSAGYKTTSKVVVPTSIKPVIVKQKDLTSSLPPSGGVGQWHPVPIEDSVSPSFDRIPAGLAPVPPADETKIENSPRPVSPSEGVGSVRVLEEAPLDIQPSIENARDGVGFVRLHEDSRERNPKLPTNPSEGVGSVRLLTEIPQKSTRPPSDSQHGVGVVRVLEETPANAPASFRSSEDKGIAPVAEEPPTLSPSVSLVVRNRTRADRTRNLAGRLDKEPGVVGKPQSLGVGLIREIISEGDDFLPPSFKSLPEVSSRLISNKEVLIRNSSVDKGSVDQGYKLNEATKHDNESYESSENSTSDADSFATEIYSRSSRSTTEFLLSKDDTTVSTEGYNSHKTRLETILYASTLPIKNDFEPNYLNSVAAKEVTTPFEEPSTAGDKISNNSDTESNATEYPGDVRASIVNHSQYPTPEPHIHAVEKRHNASFIEYHSDVSVEELSLYHTVIHSNSNSSQNYELSASENSTDYDSTEIVGNSSESLPNNSSNSGSETEFQDSGTTEEDGKAAHVTTGVDTLTDDTSQQAKIVPQLQSDLLSNDITSAGDRGEPEGFVGDLILRHITTVHPQELGTDIPAQQCPPDSIPCRNGGCGIKCDMRKDCSTNEDEENCTCADLLRSMGQSQKVCDGVDDCDDGSDESDCPWCSGKNVFRCPGSRTCIPLSSVCDRKDDCPGAHDERRCIALANSSAEVETGEYLPSGYLIVRRQGQWGKLCLDSLGQSPDLNVRIRELGRAVCSTLTYKNMTSSIRTRDESNAGDQYYQISGDTNTTGSTSLFEPSTCSAKEVLKVECETLECGLRPFAASSQRRRIVGGRSAGGIGVWPWAAALYREGEFQCGAALIGDQWLVSAAHCFYSSRGAYWSVRLGVLRRGSELPSGGEQVRRIQSIILHPDYEDEGFINDVALLRMDQPVSFSDSLRPICLPLSATEDASLWHGRRCSVIGWGKLYEIGHTFPDSLQEVRLPVISSAECQRRSLLLPAYRITPNMFCAGYDRGGRDACLGDSGGPMSCQRPADGRWVLLGVTSNGDGCGRPGRPGVYTQVASYLKWLRETMKRNVTVLSDISGSESRCPGGVRCRLGRCIPRTKLCDGRRDCASGEDEERC